MLADEPTGALDSRSGEQVMDLLAELNGRGQTILLVTHDVKLAAQHGRRMVSLRDGRVVEDVTLGAERDLARSPDGIEGTGGLARACHSDQVRVAVLRRRAQTATVLLISLLAAVSTIALDPAGPLAAAVGRRIRALLRRPPHVLL